MPLRHTGCVLIAAALGLTGCGDDNAASQGGSASGEASVATIRFDNGETLSTRVLCNLKVQQAAGQEILYTATSMSNPYFDLTEFGENSSFPGTTVSWSETEDFEVYQTSWSSAGMLGQTGFTANLQGNTITGSGTFTRGTDETGRVGETRHAEVVVECAG